MITKTKVLQGLIQNNATPWINAVVGPSLKPNTLLIQKYAQPWYGYADESTGNVKRILKVDWPYVKTIINVEG